MPKETIVDVLAGLTHCSVPEFIKLFDFCLQGPRVEALGLDESTRDDTLAQVKELMSKAVDSCHALCTAGKWHIYHEYISLILC